MSSVIKVSRLRAKWKGKKVDTVKQIGRDRIICLTCWNSSVKTKVERGQEDVLWVEVSVSEHELYRCDNCGDLVA